MRKTALLTGVAGLFLMTAPAFAQDSTAPQTPPATPPAEAQQPQSLTLTPGATVRGSDGSELGKLEGARNTPTGQELTVRGADGEVRGVPTTGIQQQGADVVTGWTSQQYQAAPPIADAAPAPSEPTAPPPPADPSSQPQPSDPATPPTPEPAPEPDEAPPAQPQA